MTASKRMYLTKSRYTKGRTCAKRLWSIVHTPPSYDETPSGPAATGIRVGELARELFPGGVLVDAAPWEHEQAAQRTQALMADKSIPAIFEAAFEHDGVRIRCDILERRPRGRWTLREVKASKSAKSEHLHDLLLQVHVLRGAGVRLEEFGIQHLNGDYKRGKHKINLEKLFTFRDVSRANDLPFAEVEAEVPAFQQILRKRKAPDIAPGLHCPGDCEFLGACTADKPDDWVRYLPRIGADRLDRLTSTGIASVADIPEDFDLNSSQKRMREAHATGRGYVSPDIDRHLRQFGPPAFYLDFETMMPAVPIYPGTSPYQQIPFQWSIHYVAKSGKTRHWEYLATGDVDPRRELTERLIAVLGDKRAPVISYSSYEKSMLNLLKAACPDLAPELDAIIDRLEDLLPLVRGHSYYPDYQFSFSIKYVAPALVPGFGYDDLKGVAEGMGAAEAFERLVRGDLAPDETVGQLRTALLAYCKRDTEAMVAVHNTLIELSHYKGTKKHNTHQGIRR